MGKHGWSRVGWGGKGRRGIIPHLQRPQQSETPLIPPRGRVCEGAGHLTGKREPSWGGVLSYGSGNAGSAKGGETEVLGPSGKLKRPLLCPYGAEKWTCLPSSWWWLPERFHISMLGPRPLVPGSFQDGGDRGSALSGHLGCPRVAPTSSLCKGETEAHSVTQGHRAVQRSVD